MNILETERLVLRRQTAEDAEFILGLMNDPDWIRYIGDRGVHTLDEAQAYIMDGAVAMYSKQGFGLYLIELKEGRTPIGICGLIKRDTLDDVDIGFALAPEFRGKGYAKEAAGATVAYGRDKIGLKRIIAIVSPDNASSIRLLEKLGFYFEETINESGTNEVLLYGLVP